MRPLNGIVFAPSTIVPLNVMPACIARPMVASIPLYRVVNAIANMAAIVTSGQRI